MVKAMTGDINGSLVRLILSASSYVKTGEIKRTGDGSITEGMLAWKDVVLAIRTLGLPHYYHRGVEKV